VNAAAYPVPMREVILDELIVRFDGTIVELLWIAELQALVAEIDQAIRTCVR
jgi:hypothetical protein